MHILVFSFNVCGNLHRNMPDQCVFLYLIHLYAQITACLDRKIEVVDA